jgi:hypothetical protein
MTGTGRGMADDGVQGDGGKGTTRQPTSAWWWKVAWQCGVGRTDMRPCTHARRVDERIGAVDIFFFEREQMSG